MSLTSSDVLQLWAIKAAHVAAEANFSAYVAEHADPPSHHAMTQPGYRRYVLPDTYSDQCEFANWNEQCLLDPTHDGDHRRYHRSYP